MRLIKRLNKDFPIYTPIGLRQDFLSPSLFGRLIDRDSSLFLISKTLEGIFNQQIEDGILASTFVIGLLFSQKLAKRFHTNDGGIGNLTIANPTLQKDGAHLCTQRLESPFEFSPSGGQFACGIDCERAAHILINLILTKRPVVDTVDGD